MSIKTWPTTPNAMAKKRRYYWLDWARFLAAFWVLIVHARGFTWVRYADIQQEFKGFFTATFFALTRVGHEAVLFFFVLSGFLVGGKLIERCLHGEFDVNSYVVDRATRIYVTLIPAIALSVLLGLLRSKYTEPQVLIGNLLGLQGVFVDSVAGNAPLWSLAYETWFYILAGAIATSLVAKSNRLLAFVLVLASILVFVKLDFVLLMTWWLGAISYFVREPKKATLLIGIAGTLLGGFFMQLTSESESMRISWIYLDNIPRNVFVLIYSGSIALIVSSIANWNPKSFHLQKFEWLGSKFSTFSYSLYLTHYPLLVFWSHLTPDKQVALDFSAFCLFFLRIFTCISVALIFYALFERHTINIRRWLIARWPRAQLTSLG